jgi:acyl carrier protein
MNTLHITTMEGLEKVFRKVLKQPTISLTSDNTPADLERWDSLHNMMIMNQLEKEFSIKIDMGEVINLKSVGDIGALIEEKIAKNNSQ